MTNPDAYMKIVRAKCADNPNPQAYIKALMSYWDRQVRNASDISERQDATFILLELQKELSSHDKQ